MNNLTDQIKNYVLKIHGPIVKSVEYNKFVFIIAERSNPKSQDCKYVFIGVKKKPKAKYLKYELSFVCCKRNLDEANISLNEKLSSLETIDIQRRKDKEQRQLLNSSLKASDYYSVGDIIYNSWGFDQTNIEFYQVVRMTNKKLVVSQISSESVEGSLLSHGMADEVTAVKDNFLDEQVTIRLTVRVNQHGSPYLVGGPSYYCFSKWDGSPKYRSWYA